MLIGMRRFRWLLAALLLGAAASAPAQQRRPLERMLDASGAGLHNEVARIFAESPNAVRSDPEAQYVAAYALLRLHRPSEARRLLDAAVAAGFPGYEGWDPAQKLLERTRDFARLRPPLALELKGNDGKVVVRAYAPSNDWAQGILKTLPSFLGRIQAALGQDVPPLELYLLSSRREYDVFYKALFGVDVPTAWQDGTGNTNVVTFCEQDRDGKALPRNAFFMGNVLHEFGHALFNTYYGDGYLDTVPNWLDEGMADELAREYYDELFASSHEILQEHLRSKPPLSYEQISRDMYAKDPDVGYAVGRLMVRDLLTGAKPRALRKILETARTKGWDAAIFEATGKKPKDAYQRVIDAHKAR